MRAFLYIVSIVFFCQFSQAQPVTSGVATVELSNFSEYATFQVHGQAAKQLYDLMRVPVQVGGVKRGPSITCVDAQNGSYYCSMSINPAGVLEGDGISSIRPQPGVGMGNR